MIAFIGTEALISISPIKPSLSLECVYFTSLLWQRGKHWFPPACGAIAEVPVNSMLYTEGSLPRGATVFVSTKGLLCVHTNRIRHTNTHIL